MTGKGDENMEHIKPIDNHHGVFHIGAPDGTEFTEEGQKGIMRVLDVIKPFIDECTERVAEVSKEVHVSGDNLELWGADPDCDHDEQPQPGGGVKCTKCGG